MKRIRVFFALFSALSMLAACTQASYTQPARGSWTKINSMHNPRADHTATLLSNGEVLISAGSSQDNFTSAELYNPVKGTWTKTGSLHDARFGQTATLLPNGDVLVVGGENRAIYFDSRPNSLASAELYDPTRGIWTTTGSLHEAHEYHTATLLNTGKVLVTGGSNYNRITFAKATLASAELYDPAQGTWITTGSIHDPREDHTSTLLRNGEVLIVGGENEVSGLTSAELYDPSKETWVPAGSLHEVRERCTATLLLTGLVLVAGGSDGVRLDGSVASAELYQFK